jgi:hypothetical protein
MMDIDAPVAPTTTFNLADLHSMVELCYGNYTIPDRNTWIAQLDHDLLAVRLGAVRLSDIEVLDSDAILAFLDPMAHSKFANPVRTSRLKTILDYVTLVTPSLDPSSLTFDSSVLSLARAAVAHKTPSPVVTPVVTPTKLAGPDFDGALSKMVDLPKLTNFKGNTGEWYTWSEGVRIIQLGSAGVSGAITAVTPAPTGATGGDTGGFALRCREILEVVAPVALTTTFNLADLNSMVELCYGHLHCP